MYLGRSDVGTARAASRWSAYTGEVVLGVKGNAKTGSALMGRSSTCALASAIQSLSASAVAESDEEVAEGEEIGAVALAGVGGTPLAGAGVGGILKGDSADFGGAKGEVETADPDGVDVVKDDGPDFWTRGFDSKGNGSDFFGAKGDEPDVDPKANGPDF